MRELRLPQALACARPFMVLACSILITLFTSIGALAQCDPDEGSIEGTVFLDSQTDGTFSAGELGISNVMVTAYDVDGVSLGFAMSDEEGEYTISNLVEGEKVSLIFSYANTFSPGVLGPDNASNVQYTNVPSCNNNIGLVDLAKACGTNPEILLTCFSQGTYNGVNRKLETILGIEHNFNNFSEPSVYARAEETGSVWGLAWKNTTKDIFSSSFVKQYSGLKDGPGAVYRTAYNGSEYETTLFADLSTLGVNVAPLINTDVFDCDYGAQVGKYGLGSIVLSPDEQWLYTINLSDNTLVKFSSTNPRTATTTITPIPDPGCSNGDARAFALVFRGDDLYVGVTCTAETSYLNGGLPSELELESSANVFKYTPDNGNWNLEFTTNYIKGYWRDDFEDSYKTIHWLTDIDFTDDDNMLISLSDRVGHRFCNDTERIDGQNPDLLVVFENAAGQWELENNGEITIDGQTVSGTGVGNTEGPGGGEFFGFDHWITDPSYHKEIALGSIVVLPGSGSVVAMVFDPITDSYSGGMHRYDTSNGEKISAKQLYTRDYTSNLGKATGFGNLVIGCGKVPLEIGNYVWHDNNNNGTQDAGENGFLGLPLDLLDEECNVIATTTTDIGGNYAFNITNVDRDQDGFFDGLLPNETYYVRVGYSVDQTGAFYTINGDNYFVCSESNAEDQTNCDINIIDGVCDEEPVIQVTTGEFGTNDHSFDIGLYTPQIFDLALKKELLSSALAATYGSYVDFKLTVINQGDKVAKSVTITDYLNDAYTFSESDNPGWTINGDLITYKHTGDILPFSEQVFYLKLQAGDFLMANELLNFAEISGASDKNGSVTSDLDSSFDQISDNDNGGVFDTDTDDETEDNGVNDEDDHDVAGANLFDLALKIEDKVENQIYRAGDRVDFVISVYNQGLIDAETFGIVNYIPEGLEFLEADIDGWVVNGSNMTFTDTDGIKRSTKKTYCISFTISDDVGNEEQLINYAEISGATSSGGQPTIDYDSTPDMILGNDNGGSIFSIVDNETSDHGENDEDDSDPVVVKLIYTDLALRKSAINNIATPGELVSFKIEVINQGTDVIGGFKVIDYFPDVLTLEDDNWSMYDNNKAVILVEVEDGLQPGKSFPLTVTFRVSDNGEKEPFVNYAEIYRIFDINGADISGYDVDSTPDELQNNDNGGKVNSSTDDSIDLDQSIDEDDQDPAMMQFITGEFISQCLCIAPNSGQFGNEIIITAPVGQTWYIDQTVGLNDFMFNGVDYTIMPYIQGVDGHELDFNQISDSESQYYFPAVSLDGQAYQITFRNENDDAVTLSGGPCNNEIIIVDGAFSLCEGSTETYTVTNPVAGAIYAFDLPSGGTISDQTATTVTIDWDNTIGGPYELVVSNSTLQIFGSSCQAPTLVGGVGVTVGQSDGPMSCIGDVNISLNQNCELLVRPQTVAAGPLDPSAPYSIMLTMPDGTVIPNNVLTEEHIGIEVTAKLIEGCGGNSCWSTITVEDKLPPVLYCEDTEIVCYNYDTYQGPIAIDACDGVVEAYQVGAEDIFVYDCHPDYVRKVTRQYQAEDSKGNVSEMCTIEIFVKKINIDDIVYPADIVGDDAFACDEVDYNDDGYPTLESTGVPTINGEPLLPGITPLCNIAMDYKDRLVGPIGCTTKVMREFRLIYNECTSNQIISNGSFESGDFSDWEELGPNGLGCDQDWIVETGPVNFCTVPPGTVELAAAPDGNQAAYVAADGSGPLEREIRQIVSVPLDVTAASLSWQQTYSIDLVNYCVGCMARMYAIEIYDVTGTTLLGIVHEEMFMAGQIYNQPWTANSADITSLLSSVAGQDVMLSVKIMIPESFTGPGQLGVDAFELDVTTSDALPITKIFKYTQTIELEDNNPPVFVQMADITVSAGSGNCEASVFLPAPEVTDACADEIEIDIRYPGGFANDQSSTFVLLPGGTSEVTYLAYDECGNVDSMKVNVTVMDMTAPVVVCDVPTALGINSEGIGYAYAATFDDGSTDACGIDYMKVRRLDDGADCGPESTTFGDFVVFCCADVGNEVMVEFQVVDFAGNANSCMVSVVVQDKFPPAISCPVDVTVDCGTPFDLEDLSEYGTAIATDACMVTIEEEAIYAPENACGEGVITRTFVASDNNGSATCTQTITFVNDSPFLLGDITFPPNYDTEICDRDALEPEQLPAPFNEPLINDDDCDMIAFAYSDEIFDFTGDNACYKIYRTWTVINWCVMVNGTPETFVGFQVIKVNNTITPEIVEDCEPLIVCSFDDNCESGDITLTKTATDDCTLPGNMLWSYIIQFESGATLVNNGIGNAIDASGNYELGNHTITYTFEDRCGNVISCIQSFSIQNCTPPNAVCIDGLSVELVPMDTDNDGEVDAEMACLFAYQLNASSAHSCDLPLVYSFSADTSNTKMLYDCSYLGENEVTLWVTDSNGNTDICISTLIVQDNNDVEICNSYEECVTFPENVLITTCNADLTPEILGLVPVVDTDCTNCDDFDVTYTDVLFTYPNTDCNYIERFFVVTFNCLMSPIIVEGSHIISLLDAVAPTIDCPADGSAVATDGSGLSCEAFVTLDPATFISNCNSIVTITNDSDFADDDGADASGTYPVGTTEVTFTAADACNNTSTCTINVVVTDEMSPVCDIADVTVNVTSTGSTIIDLGDINNQSTDACGGTVTVVSVTPNSFSCTDIGVINFITVVVEDASGNQAECTDVGLTIIDIEDPICSTQDITVSINSGETSVTVTPDMVDFGSVDNCSGIESMSLDQTQFTCDQLGSQTVTLTVTDQFNNSSTCTSTVTVEEMVPPTCVAGTITLSIGADGTATLDPVIFGAGSTDDCGSIETYDASQTMFTCDDLGENTITLTVTDTYNNTSTCTGTVIVEETDAPICVTQDITVNILDGQTSVSIDPEDVDDGSSDGCGAVTLVSVVPSSFTCDDLGENTVTLTVEDTNGNTSECTALVTVGDLVPPTCNAGTITILIDANGTATVDAAALGANSTDDCGEIATYSVLPETFTCDDLGPNTVTLTVTDNNGNTSTCTGTVIVEENDAPMCVTQNITVNILDGTTSISIVPSDVDDGSSDGCGTVTLVSVTPNTFTCDDLGENTVTLTVQDDSGNSSTCTAIVTVGDLVPPTCNAGTFTVTLTDTGSVTITGEDIDNGSTDDCGAIATYSVFPDTFDCTQAGDNTVTLTVTDDNGNSSTCEGTVTVIDNVAPVCNTKDITISLEDNGAILINAFFINEGSFDPCGGALQSLTVSPFSFNCEDIGENIVVMTVIDASGNSSTCEATVTIEDTDAPTCEVQDITVSLTTEAGTTVDATDFDNGSSDECGGPLTFDVDQSTFGCDDLGTDNLVVITVTDQYGNSSTCTANVTVEDDIEIQCVSQDITVNLESNGMVIITPEQIDNGSSAGCDQPITLSLDRDDFTCNDTSFGEIEVTLTVTVDATGETSECTANVTVIDTIEPTITCMADVTVDCVDFTGNLESYGNIDNIEASDNCAGGLVVVEQPTVEDINVCGIGTYTRTFIATDLAGNADTCSQIVTVVLGDNPLVEEDLTFPPDTLIFGDCSAFDPDNLDTTVAIDSMSAECFNVSINFVDTGINIDTPCNDTITRTYTVLDSCQIGTGAGEFTFVQTIIINDTTAPIITGPEDLTVTVQDTMTCTIALDLSGFNVDNCDENFTVTNNSTFADTQDSGDASGVYPIGEHEITLTATDDCNNSSTYVYNVNVQDSTYAYLTCQKIQPDMEADLSVDIIASQVADTIQFFNCLGTPVDTIISYSNTDMNDTIRAYGCEAVDQPVEFWIYLYLDGIAVDSCRGTVQLLDPTDLCNDGLVGTVVGTVFTADNEPVPGVLVDLDGSDESIMTDEDGYYAFPEMIGGEAYEVIPNKDDDPMNGVTTLDLILIQRHILGLTDLDSPYDLIAADIDASGSLSGIDIIQLRKMILGIYNDFPDNTSWRMVDREFTFWDPENAHEEAFPETYDIDALTSTMKADFIGVKTGDVNGSVIPSLDSKLESETRSDKTWYLQAIDKNVKAGESVTVEIILSEDTELQGFQMAISTEMIRDISLASSSISITEDNYTIDGSGVMNISWNTLNELQLTAGSKILEVTIVPTVDTKLSEMISISDEGVESQTYADNDIAHTRTEILWESGMSEFALYQNTPNPWTQSTDIDFMIPADGKVTINVRSVNGQKVKTFEGYYESGVHSVKLTNEDLLESGVYYYEMRYDNKIVVEKMILLR